MPNIRAANSKQTHCQHPTFHTLTYQWSNRLPRASAVGRAARRLTLMAPEIWVTAAVIITIVDLVVIVVSLAKFTDRRLEGTGNRLRFSMMTLLVATALIAIHTALLVWFFGPSN